VLAAGPGVAVGGQHLLAIKGRSQQVEAVEIVGV